MSVWLLSKITHQKDMDILWFTRNSKDNFPVQKRKIFFFFKDYEHLSVSLSISLLMAVLGPVVGCLESKSEPQLADF